MKRPKQLRIGAALPLLLLGGILCVHAQPGPGGPPPPSHRPSGPAPGGQHFRAPGAHSPLDRVLTPEQRESLRDRMESQRGEMRELEEKLRDARMALHEALFAQTFEEDTVQKWAKAAAELDAQLTVTRAKAIAGIQPPLTPEQREQLRQPPQPVHGGPQPSQIRPHHIGPEGPRPRPEHHQQPRPPERPKQ